jgi:hypothetical protein
MFGDNYIAGIWQYYLASELIWFVEPNNIGMSNYELAERLVNYRGPCFSWVSIDGAITPSLHSDKGIYLRLKLSTSTILQTILLLLINKYKIL